MWSKIKRMRLLIYKLALIFLISFVFIESPNAFSQNQAPTSMEVSGQELFIQNRCVRCHSIGRGRFVGPDLYRIGERYSKNEVIKWIENPQQIYQETGKMPFNEGYPPMPPMNIPQSQAEAIADYILSFELSENPAKSGTISGQVVNETADIPASEIELTITSYMGDRPTDEKTIKSDEQGNFSFGELKWDRSYKMTVNYEGSEYSTDKMVFDPNEDVKTLVLPIYEPTFDEADISVLEVHMIVQLSEEVLSVANISLFQNSGDKVYVGGKDLEDGRKESLRLSIPKGARDLNFIHGVNPENLVQTQYGVAETTSILPGEKRVVYTYSIPLESNNAELEQMIDYPTKSFLLLVSDTDETTTVSGLGRSEQVEVQGQKFLKWSGADLAPGKSIELRIHGSFLKEDYLKYGALAILLVLIIAGVVYSSLSKKTTGAEATPGEDNLSDRRSALIKEIAKLDDDFEEGNIDETTYKNTREIKKNELKKIIRRL